EALTPRVAGTLDRTTEPQTNYTVARAGKEFRSGNTTIGAIVTGVNRDLDSWSDAFLRKSANAYGANFSHRWGASRYELVGHATQSIVSGSRQSIYSTQVNSTHNYQRPDAGLLLDSMRTSLTGSERSIN